LTPSREQQIRALFRAALERPPSERAEFVTDLAGDDRQLRESVEVLLSRHSATDVGAGGTTSGPQADDLPTGTQVGHYRIEGVLGRGGMGVVYRATDTKLQRPVAIKFLAIEVAETQAKSRFRQEAKTASGLNHPHIVTVYDVGEHDGGQYIVSELVDGGTLDDWAAANRNRGWRQSVELVTGVADAIAAAHGAGVLHRDIKPGNILIGANGYAKLADFGLAKLVDAGPHSSGKPAAPTAHNTRAGIVIGTAAYMSPEQAAGLAVDARSDVFAFGIVLYELLAGRRPFDGANDLEVLKRIMHGVPAELPHDLPEPLRAAVEKSLEKDPAERYQDMRDLVVDLKRVVRKPTSSTIAVDPTLSSRARSRWMWWLAGALAALVVALLIRQTVQSPTGAAAPAERMMLEVSAPGHVVRAGALAISPDGRRVAYVANVDGRPRIWIRSLLDGTTRARPGTENARGLFWSPDGRYLGFVAGGKLKTIDADGGPIADRGDAVYTTGAWSADGFILYTTVVAGLTIARQAASGGTVTPLTTMENSETEYSHTFPRPLPNGRDFLYVASDAADTRATVYVASLGEFRRDELLSLDRLTDIAYAEGYLLYLRDSTLVAQAFDPDTRTLRGEAMRVVDGVGEFSVAGHILVYSEPAPPFEMRLTWFDRTGQRLGTVAAPPHGLPVLSPDDRQVAFVTGDPGGRLDIWTVDVERGTRTRVTFDPGNDFMPLWSHDGSRITFAAGRGDTPGGFNHIFQRAANGTGSEEPLYSVDADQLAIPLSWSPDGQTLLVSRAITGGYMRGGNEIWMVRPQEKVATPLLRSPFFKRAARISPDGRWMAYETNESGIQEIVIQPFPEPGTEKWPVSSGGGYEPEWRSDGQELFYLSPDGELMAVDVEAGDTLKVGAPHVLFGTGIDVAARVQEQLGGALFFDPSDDGQRFLVDVPYATGEDAGKGSSSIKVMLDWTAGLAKQQ
jgi:serine/threonine protein kinase/Tol biopolymer transport system component